MKKLLFLGACLVALASQPVAAQTTNSEVIVVRVYDNNSGKFVIARAGGKTEEIPFNPSYSSKGLAESSSQLQQAITSLYQQGYALKSTFSGNSGVVATLIFVKEK